MSKDRARCKNAPVITCHSSTAVRLEAALVCNVTEVKKARHACIPVRGHDGSRSGWLIKQEFLEAVERR